MHGFGVFKWPDGRRYEGEYAFGKKNGIGAYVMNNKSVYKGKWLNGL